VGTTSTIGEPRLDVVGNSASGTGEGIVQIRRGGSVTTNNVTIGALNFGDTTSGGFRRAQIVAASDGAGGSGDLPTRLVFTTTADSESVPAERMRIESDGTMLITAGSANKGIDLLANGSRVARFAVLNPGVDHTPYIGSVLGNDFYFMTNNTERMRIDSSGRVLIGSTTVQAHPNMDDLQLGDGSGNRGLTISSGTSSYGTLAFGDSADASGSDRYSGSIEYYHADNSMRFYVDIGERLKINSSGTVFIPNTGGFPSVAGHTFFASGQAMHATNTDTLCLLLNRQHSDGTLIQFRQAAAAEGSISVNGSTVSYNGGHLSRWSQLPGGTERIEILRGSVLSNVDEMCVWAYEATDAVLYTEGDELPEGVSVGDVKEPARAAGSENNEQLNRMKVSDIEGDKNVAGVFMCWDDDDDTYTNDFYCSMTGDFIIRIAQGTTVERGDLLMSAGDGTAKPQDDDIVRSKTVAKVTSTTVSENYSDGSYCVPCVLMAC